VARVLGAADHHQRAASLEHEQQLALKQEDRLRRLRPLLDRVAASRRALDYCHVGQLRQALVRQPGKRCQVASCSGVARGSGAGST